jgi:hypothetical protein
MVEVHRRVVELVEDLKTLAAAEKDLKEALIQAQSEEPISPMAEEKLWNDVSRAKSEFDDAKHQFEEMVEAYCSVPDWYHNLLIPDLFVKNRGSRPDAEFELAHCAITLAQKGYLDALQLCDCGDWFWRKRTNQTACSPRCRQKKYEGTEAFKAKRNVYMRWYYATTSSRAWSRVPRRKRPTLEQWLKFEKPPTPEQWLKRQARKAAQ